MRRISSAAYVTAVLRFLQAYNAADFDAVEEVLVPDVQWDGLVSYRGSSEVRGHLESMHARRPHARPEDFREAGGRVLIIVAFGDEHESWVCDLTEEGKITRVVVHPNPVEAARALERAAAPA